MTTSTLCSICQSANSAGSRFCLRCGVALPQPAPDPWRGFIAHDGYLFGEAILPAEPPAPAAIELRLLRAVSSDSHWQRLRMPMVTAGTLIVLLAAVMIGIAALNPWSGASIASLESGTAIAGGKPGSVEQVIAAIETSNEAEVLASRKSDPALLEGKMTGQELEDNRQAIRRRLDQGTYQVSELIDIQYQPVEFGDADHATVRTTEIWQSVLYSRDGKQAGARGPDTLREVYHLIRQNGYWLVERIDLDNAGKPAPGTAD